MEIIKKGKLPELEPIKKTCGNCKTIFTYVRADIQTDMRDGNYVKCPVCRKFINVD